MKVKLDRTVCDGFMRCAEHAPESFALDDWGYASLTGTGDIGADDEVGVRRALMDCPVHAITELE
jgi:ferredoxin